MDLSPLIAVRSLAPSSGTGSLDHGVAQCGPTETVSAALRRRVGPCSFPRDLPHDQPRYSELNCRRFCVYERSRRIFSRFLTGISACSIDGLYFAVCCERRAGEERVGVIGSPVLSAIAVRSRGRPVCRGGQLPRWFQGNADAELSRILATKVTLCKPRLEMAQHGAGLLGVHCRTEHTSRGTDSASGGTRSRGPLSPQRGSEDGR
jgi:hypothetical protein